MLPDAQVMAPLREPREESGETGGARALLGGVRKEDRGEEEEGGRWGRAGGG